MKHRGRCFSGTPLLSLGPSKCWQFDLWFLCLAKVKESEVAQSCPTLCDPMDCGLSGSSVHGIFQARVLEWIAI